MSEDILLMWSLAYFKACKTDTPFIQCIKVVIYTAALL